MIISHKKKFIFIHIYKTGGTSLTDKLIRWARFREQVAARYTTRYIIRLIGIIFGLTDKGLSWINGVHKHATALEIKEYIGDDNYNSYFKFAFVRNPYDLLVSKYFYIRQNRWHVNNSRLQQQNFKAFVNECITKKIKTQTDFLTDNDNNIIVDFVGKTENLNESAEFIFSKIGLEYESIDHLNSSKRSRDYLAQYDNEMLALVNSYFDADFNNFNYKKVWTVDSAYSQKDV